MESLFYRKIKDYETLSAKRKKFGELFNPALNEDSDSVDDILFQNFRRGW